MAGHRGLDVTGWSRCQQAAEVHLGLMLINNLRQLRVIGKIYWTRGCGPRDVCGESGGYLSYQASTGVHGNFVGKQDHLWAVPVQAVRV
jgi:hypothetical protein